MPYLPDSPRLYYETHGLAHSLSKNSLSKDAATLILIHGLGSSTADWEHQLESFSRVFNLVLVDLRGFGQSEKPPGPYNIPVMAEDILRLMDHLELNQAHVLGISLGGWTGLQLAAVTAPERLHSLTVVNSSAHVKPRTLKQYLEVSVRLLLFRFLSMEKIGKILARRLFPKPELAQTRQIFVQRWAQNNKKSYMAAFRGALGWSVLEHLKHIRVPVHIISSEFDYIELELKQEMLNKLTNAHLTIIDDARHAVTVERPEEFNRAALAFLRNL